MTMFSLARCSGKDTLAGRQIVTISVKGNWWCITKLRKRASSFDPAPLSRGIYSEWVAKQCVERVAVQRWQPSHWQQWHQGTSLVPGKGGLSCQFGDICTVEQNRPLKRPWETNLLAGKNVHTTLSINKRQATTDASVQRWAELPTGSPGITEAACEPSRNKISHDSKTFLPPWAFPSIYRAYDLASNRSRNLSCYSDLFLITSVKQLCRNPFFCRSVKQLCKNPSFCHGAILICDGQGWDCLHFPEILFQNTSQ